MLKKPFTSLLYANGPGYTGSSVDQDSKKREEGPKKFVHNPKEFFSITNGRPALTHEIVTGKDYLQEAAIPLSGETHGGEDVPIFASGPQAHLFRGVREQNYIFHVMKYAYTGDL
jgi:alkaline phosphatase